MKLIEFDLHIFIRGHFLISMKITRVLIKVTYSKEAFRKNSIFFKTKKREIIRTRNNTKQLH